jgi:hypothetical protein
MELNSKTIDELKVIAYDLLASKEQTERNLQIVNQTIAAKYEELNKSKVEDATIES